MAEPRHRRAHRPARRCSDSVLFTGYVPFEDLPALYNLAEMFVFPSIYEGFGLPVIEAMACGTPVITGRVPRAGRSGRRRRRARRGARRGRARRRAGRAGAGPRTARRSWRARGLAAGARILVGAARHARRSTSTGGRGRRHAAGRQRPRRAGRLAGSPAAAQAITAVMTHARRPLRPGVLPAVRPQAVGARGSRTRRSARSTPRRPSRARGYDVGALRRDARRVGSRLGGGPRRAPPARSP